MKRLISKTAVTASLLAVIVFSGCFSVFADSAEPVYYKTGQNNTLVTVCLVLVIAAAAVLLAVVIIKRRKNK